MLDITVVSVIMAETVRPLICFVNTAAQPIVRPDLQHLKGTIFIHSLIFNGLKMVVLLFS